jgi:hypothetical protein
MKITNSFSRFPALVVTWLLTSACGTVSATGATEQPPAQPMAGQKTFASPDEAVTALKAATENQDRSAMRAIFGPELNQMLTGDKVQDANNHKRFAAALALGCKQIKDGDDKIVLEVGTNDWPMPIPLVKSDGQWHFDTAAGKEEIINRHIGKDELTAIGVCHEFVDAQRRYAGINPNASGEPTYAQKFKSTTGKRDGLYWEPAVGEPASPFGPLVAEAHAEGYTPHKAGTGPHPFHGYVFRILTRQGKDAPGGKKNYISRGNMTGGFAMVAYPEKWDQSGVMTFIVSQDGKIYQRDLGDQTTRVAGSMQEYNPTSDWTAVQDQGVANAVTER